MHQQLFGGTARSMGNTYKLEGGNILRKGEIVGKYDVQTGTLIELREDLPKQMRKIISNMLRPVVPQVHEQPSSITGPSEEYASNYIPKPPPMHPKYGDKTPAYVEWMRHYKPDEAAKLYKGRQLGIPEPSGGDIPASHMGAEPAEEWK